MNRIVDGIVKTATFLALDGHTGDEVTYIDHVAQLAEILAYLHTLEEVFSLFIQQVETIPATLPCLGHSVFLSPSCMLC